MGDRHITIAAVLGRHGCKAVEPAAVLLPFERIQHLLHQIVDIEKFKLGIAVVDPDGQIVGGVMAKGRHGAVIVGAAPLAEEVGETIDKHFGTRLGGIAEKQLLPRLLAAAVVAVVSADKRRLDRRGQHHGTSVMMPFERCEQLQREAEVARHKLGGMLRAVDTCQMKDEICFLAILVQLFLRRIEIVLVNLIDLERRTGAILIIAKVFKRLRQIFPYKPLRPGNENVHLFALFMQFGELLPDIGELQELVLDFLHIEKLRVVGVEFAQQVALRVALLEILIVVEAAVVAGNAVEVAEIDGARAFFVGEQRFVHLLAMADADDADVLLPAAKELAHGLGLRLDRAGGCLLHQNIAARAVLEGEEDEIDRLIERHDEARHRRLRDGDGIAVLDLVDPERNDAPPRAHDVAVARAADLRLVRRAGLGDDDLLHHGLGGTHRVDGIGGLVRGETDDRLDALLDGSR